MMKFILSLFTFLSITITLAAQDFDAKKMDAFFDRLAEKEKGMGSISIFYESKEVYQRSIGYADLEEGIAADQATKYRIGSISKTYMATIIMELVEEEKLSLETPLSQYYPKLPNADKISIEQLLRHRSGLFNFTSIEDYLTWNTRFHTEEELLKKVVENGTVFEPGEKAEYSNTNFLLLSLIAQKIYTKSFDEIFEERIIKPLELENNFVGRKINRKNNEAYSYMKLDSWIKEAETNMSVPMGAGAVVANATDVSHFFAALFAGKLISEKSLQQIIELKDDFGLGIFSFPFNEKTAYGHTGGIDGFQSMAGYFPEEKLSITYLSNGVVYPINDIMIAALSIYFGKEFEIPSFEATHEVSSEDLDVYLGMYANPAFPLKIEITKKGNQLYGQATGQGAFPLEPTAQHQFRFETASIKMEFVPEKNIMKFSQGGMDLEFTRE